MLRIEHQFTALYVFVEECLQAQRPWAWWRHSPHAHAAFSDAAVLPLALLPGCLGGARLQQTDRLVATNWQSAFPPLCSYGQGRAGLHALSGLLGALLRATTHLSLQSPAF
jgi:hypothetical protein